LVGLRRRVMSGERRVEGKVAFITGAARGQGREHALRLAEEGADIIAVDLCSQVANVVYEGARPEDLDETVRQVEALDRRIVARQADVRDQGALDAALRDGLDQLGHVDIVCANAGITTTGRSWELSEDVWQEMIDINLTGVWHTVKAAVPTLLEQDRGGSIVLTSSLCGVKGLQNVGHYVAAKHGVIGLMRTMANELGPAQIRVNSVLPGNVRTPMVTNEVVYRVFRPDLEHPTEADILQPLRDLSAMDVPYLESRDISNAVLFLASDESRFITGLSMNIDAGWHIT
jgi:(+)-trans-carveol dehydrogenase